MRYVVRFAMSVAASVAIMVAIFYFYIYSNGYLDMFIKLVTTANYVLVLLAILIKLIPPTIHSYIWYLLLKPYIPRCRLLSIIRMGFTSLYAEYLVPIGGVTEVIKVGLTSMTYGGNLANAVFSVALHRVVNSLALASLAIFAITYVGIGNFVGLVITLLALSMVGMNLTIFLALRSRSVAKRLGKLTKRFFRIEYTVEGLKLPNYSIVASALALSFVEHTLTACSSYLMAKALSIEIGFWEVVIVFNSLYAVVWFLPVMTPGFIGLLDWIQIEVLNFLGLTKSIATTLVIYNTVIRLIAEVPMFTVAMVKTIGGGLSKVGDIVAKFKAKIP